MCLLMVDELACQSALQYSARHGLALGTAAVGDDPSAPAMTQEEMKNHVQPSKLATEIKFFTLVGTRDSAVHVVGMRPGNANMSDETSLNTIMSGHVNVVCKEFGVTKLGM